MNQFLVIGGSVVATVGGFLGWVALDDEIQEKNLTVESSLAPDILPPEVAVKVKPPEPVREAEARAKPKPQVRKARAKPKPQKRKARPNPRPKPPQPKSEMVMPVIQEEQVVVKSQEQLRQDAINRILIKSQQQAFMKPVVLTTSQQEQDKNKDQNKAEDWNVNKDENTYPFDLTRVVTKEMFIPAVTRNRIVSKLAGKVLLLITRNVYGSHGRLILIPAGSQASGYYQPLAKVGDDRLMLVIERIVKPDGDLIIFKKTALGADASGATGVPGDVDNHYYEKFGIPLIFSTLNSASNAALRQMIANNSSNPNNSQVFNGEWQQNQKATNNQVIQEIIKNNINITPVITIEAGTALLLFLQSDIFFKPNLNGQTEAQTVSIGGTKK